MKQSLFKQYTPKVNKIKKIYHMSAFNKIQLRKKKLNNKNEVCKTIIDISDNNEICKLKSPQAFSVKLVISLPFFMYLNRGDMAEKSRRNSCLKIRAFNFLMG